ncbi:MAG: serine/threonine protein phosphatase [Thermotogaceae bacterium]|nr:serine/threonine protein phosphatase [Thermotogaceae bacterium]
MLYAIGDIHGMYEPLIALFNLLPLSKGDKIIFLGDYIDRGPQSRKVIEFLKVLKNNHKVLLLKGNHEDMLIKCIENGECFIWKMNGCAATVSSFGGIENIRKELNFFKSLKISHEEGKFFFVHGGVKPGVPLENQQESDMIWIRDEFIYSENPLPGKIVVFGHTPFEEVLIMKDKIGIDTGCVYGGKLSAIRLDDMKVFSIECRRY